MITQSMTPSCHVQQVKKYSDLTTQAMLRILPSLQSIRWLHQLKITSQRKDLKFPENERKHFTPTHHTTPRLLSLNKTKKCFEKRRQSRLHTAIQTSLWLTTSNICMDTCIPCGFVFCTIRQQVKDLATLCE